MEEELDRIPPDKHAEVERKLLIIKVIREEQEEKDRTFEELRKIGVDPSSFRDDPFFLW